MLISFVPAPLHRRGLAKDLSKRALATEARTWPDYGDAAAELRFVSR